MVKCSPSSSKNLTLKIWHRARTLKLLNWKNVDYCNSNLNCLQNNVYKLSIKQEALRPYLFYSNGKKTKCFLKSQMSSVSVLRYNKMQGSNQSNNLSFINIHTNKFPYLIFCDYSISVRLHKRIIGVHHIASPSLDPILVFIQVVVRIILLHRHPSRFRWSTSGSSYKEIKRYFRFRNMAHYPTTPVA